MTGFRVFWRRLRGRAQRDRWEADLDDELRFHIQMEIERHEQAGLSAAEARRQALRGIGGVDVTKEAYRDQKQLPFIEMFVQDVRFALRMLVKDRAFTAVAVLTLALGIGANTAIFSVVNGVLLKPLPFDGADRIVTVWEDYSALDGPSQEWVEIPNLLEWKAETGLFDTLVVYSGLVANLTGRGEPQRLNLQGVSADFFRTFAVAPQLGRDFSEADDQPGAPGVMVLSHGFWQREFAGDPAVLGSTVSLSGEPVTVVGVMPAEFEVPGFSGVEGWLPARIDPARNPRSSFSWLGLARLKAGVTVEAAEGRLNVLMAEIGNRFPENRGVTVSLVPLLDQLVTPVRTSLYVLLGVVVFVLLIACANIANLMLSRSATRAREMAVRVALGAGRGRLVRQLLTESLVLALAGAALGLLLAVWGTSTLTTIIPPSAAPRLENVAIDATVLVFTLGISLFAALLFGLAPVLQSFRSDVGSTLKYGGRQSQEAAGGGRLRALLAAGQVALALCLLIAAGLTLRSFAALVDVNPGFEPDGVTTGFVSMPTDSFAGSPELVDFMGRLRDRVAREPGIESVAAVSVLPLSGGDSDTGFEIEGRPELNVPGREPVVWYRRVTASYFETMGIPLERGREFTDQDRMGAPPVVMISDVAATRFWPNGDALGSRIRFGTGDWHTIVGIVSGVRYSSLNQPPRPELYFPYAQRPGRAMTLVVRSGLTEVAVGNVMRTSLQELAPTLPLSNVTSMSSLVESSVAQPRFLMNLTAGFGVLALVLASVGIYGVMAYSVSRRTSEMGLRMALGSGRVRVLGMVVAHGAWMTTIGVAVGLLVAWWATGMMASVLYSVEARDVVTFTAAPAVLVMAALLACLVPALRATRIDPMVALRDE